MQRAALNDFTAEGLRYLSFAIQEDGSFTAVSRSLEGSGVVRAYSSPFFTSLIVLALEGIPRSFRSRECLVSRAANFVSIQKSNQWSFNYWPRGSVFSQELPYPDDLDDTSVSLAALTVAQPEVINGKVLACATRHLLATEVVAGGPYRTWLSGVKTTPSSELVPDIAVNANIAYFLKLHQLELKPLCAYLDSCMDSADLLSRYYPSVWPVLYFLSRAVPSRLHESLGRALEQCGKVAKPMNILESALCLTALLTAHAPDQSIGNAYADLLSRLSGGFKDTAFCFDPTFEKKRYGAGSKALTCALVLQSLWKYEEWQKKQQGVMSIRVPSSGPQRSFTEELHAVIHREAAEKIALLPKELSKIASDAHVVLRQKDTEHQVALLPAWFATGGLEPNTELYNFVVACGTASVLGWIAYIMYDRVMDTGQSLYYIPVANTLLLELSSIYRRVLSRVPGGAEMFTTIMQRMEAGNAWELVHARISVSRNSCSVPVYLAPALQSAEKSLGHAIAPLAVYSMQHTGSPHMQKTLLGFFEHYLAARQLNDDAHDWCEDMTQGHITSVTYEVMKGCAVRGRVHLINQKSELQNYFWGTALHSAANTILHHIMEARLLLGQLGVPQERYIDGRLLLPLERAALMAKAHSHDAALFLQAYRQ